MKNFKSYTLIIILGIVVFILKMLPKPINKVIQNDKVMEEVARAQQNFPILPSEQDQQKKRLEAIQKGIDSINKRSSKDFSAKKAKELMDIRAQSVSDKIVKEMILNRTLEEIFSGEQLESYKFSLSTKPSKENKEELLDVLGIRIVTIQKIIEIYKNTGKFKVVPKSLQKLMNQFKEKEKQVKAFNVEN